MRKVINIVLIVILGIFVAAFLSGLCWYLCGYYYYIPKSNGFFSYSKEGSAAIGAVIGVMCGSIGGLILGLIITIIGLNKLSSFFVGVCVNGIIPLFFFAALAGNDMGNILLFPKDILLSLVGQFIAGGIVGIFVSALSEKWRKLLT